MHHSRAATWPTSLAFLVIAGCLHGFEATAWGADAPSATQPKKEEQQQKTSGAPSEINACFGGGFETVPLYYADPSKLLDVLTGVKLPSELCAKVVGQSLGTPRSIEIYGDEAGRALIKRFIGSFDLPRERVNMDLWAVQISSPSSAKLSDVMGQVQQVVDQTREAMQDTYQAFSDLSLKYTIVEPPTYTGSAANEPSNSTAKLVQYGFQSSLAPDWEPSTPLSPPRLSLTQMLLRLNFAVNPINNYNKAALEICNFLAGPRNSMKLQLYNSFPGQQLKAYDNQRIFNNDPPRAFRRPFQRFFTVGLHQEFPDGSKQPVCGDGAITAADWEKQDRALKRRQQAILRFANEYNRFRRDPAEYDPSELAKSAAIVDGMLSPVVDAINRDIDDYFMQPMLFKIREIVGRNRGVEYAEVGRSTVAGINGQTVKVISGTISSFDEPTPLRLKDWLRDAATEKQAVTDVFSGTGTTANLGKVFPSLTTSNLPGVKELIATLPLTNAVALMAALSTEEIRWQTLSSGLQLNLTPVLMRDQMQAEVKVDLVIADPAALNQATGKPDEEYGNTKFGSSDPTKVRPLSRISKSILDTKVYVNTMDLFALSSYNNQTTITGRRWYVPLLGTIWQGAFGDIPVVGGWFSFRRPPQNLQHQSIILSSTLLVPSAMAMASYYTTPTSQPPVLYNYQIRQQNSTKTLDGYR